MLNQIAEKIENELKSADAGLYCDYAPGYRAIASESENGYVISYFKTTEDMPAFKAEAFDAIEDCVKEMVKISVDWRDGSELLDDEE